MRYFSLILFIFFSLKVFAVDTDKPVWEQADKLFCEMHYFNVCQNMECSSHDFRQDKGSTRAITINFKTNEIKDLQYMRESKVRNDMNLDQKIISKIFTESKPYGRKESVLIVQPERYGGSTLFKIFYLGGSWNLDKSDSGWNNETKKNISSYTNFSCVND